MGPSWLDLAWGIGWYGHPINDHMTNWATSNASHGINCHHQMYEDGYILMSVNGSTEQLLIEHMISSVHISLIWHMDKLQPKSQHSQFKPKHVAALFGVSLSTVKNFFNVMTQKCVRHGVMPLTQSYHVDNIHLHHMYLAGKWMLDHVKSKYKMIHRSNHHLKWQFHCNIPHCIQRRPRFYLILAAVHGRNWNSS